MVYISGKAKCASGHYSMAEEVILRDTFELFKGETQPGHTVYLQLKPEEAYIRLLHRDRAEEGAVNITYLRTLHELHESWLNRAPDPDNISIVDAEQPAAAVLSDVVNIIKRFE